MAPPSPRHIRAALLVVLLCILVAQLSAHRHVVYNTLKKVVVSTKKKAKSKGCASCCQTNTNLKNVRSTRGGVRQTKKHYGEAIDKYAAHFKLSPEYLKALVMLECGGRKRFNPRFEPHVCKSLTMVREGARTNYEYVRSSTLTDAPDAALQNLATSWGPFQIMGYKCVEMDVKVGDLRGDSAIYWGIKWIDKAYGGYIRAGRYEDAFHIHNTGVPVPKNGRHRTYDPKYVANGVKYMKRFKD